MSAKNHAVKILCNGPSGHIAAIQHYSRGHRGAVLETVVPPTRKKCKSYDLIKK